MLVLRSDSLLYILYGALFPLSSFIFADLCSSPFILGHTSLTSGNLTECCSYDASQHWNDYLGYY